MITAPKFRRFAVLLLSGLMAVAFSVAQSQDESGSDRKVIKRIQPQYPDMARRMGINGSVRMDAVVEPNGSVKTVEVKGGHPVLAVAAENAVKMWKYEAGPKETREPVEVRFVTQ